MRTMFFNQYNLANDVKTEIDFSLFVCICIFFNIVVKTNQSIIFFNLKFSYICSQLIHVVQVLGPGLWQTQGFEFHYNYS